MTAREWLGSHIEGLGDSKIEIERDHNHSEVSSDRAAQVCAAITTAQRRFQVSRDAMDGDIHGGQAITTPLKTADVSTWVCGQRGQESQHHPGQLMSRRGHVWVATHQVFDGRRWWIRVRVFGGDTTLTFPCRRLAVRVGAHRHVCHRAESPRKIPVRDGVPVARGRECMAKGSAAYACQDLPTQMRSLLERYPPNRDVVQWGKAMDETALEWGWGWMGGCPIVAVCMNSACGSGESACGPTHGELCQRVLSTPDEANSTGLQLLTLKLSNSCTQEV